MKEGKYVINARGDVKVFDRTGIHSYMACTCPFEDCEGRAVSAGFFEVDQGIVKTFGESTTLRIKSRPEDAELVAKELLTEEIST